MLIEIYIFFELILIALFFTAFFTKQELIWSIVVVIAGVMMFTSYHVETYVYQWNSTMLAYQPVIESNYYPYLSGLNIIFFGLGLLLGLFDIFDKYGSRLLKKDEK